MNEIKVNFWEVPPLTMEEIFYKMDGMQKQSLEFAPWVTYPYKPETKFSIAYDFNHIYLKYYVCEKNIRLTVEQTNGPVWEDSCVEFFMTLEEHTYYNIECNCIGTVTAGYGRNKANHQQLPIEVVKQIKCQSKVLQKNCNSYYWEIAICIPLGVFLYHKSFSLRGQRVKANFCKCGDALPEPHFLSWVPIESNLPNFHLPQFFRTVLFA